MRIGPRVAGVIGALALLASDAGFAARNDAPVAVKTDGSVPAAQDVEGAIASACSGLSGTTRHECIYEVLAKERRRSGR